MEGFVIALFVCLVLALITKYLSVPAIPFYILAGVILGKAGLGIVQSDEISHFFSEMGLIFLLFFMGLGLKLERIAANRSAVLTSGIIDLNVNMIIGFFAAYLLGFYHHGVPDRCLGILYLKHGDGDHLAYREQETDVPRIRDDHLADGL